ncbi:MAG: ABC transporter substrate-binding protein [Holosporaceae bacterium]|jgi:ABC-type transporter MlaC component|nr:ABC transporter substrate-binding protein [Holosporaceae bacterium]
MRLILAFSAVWFFLPGGFAEASAPAESSQTQIKEETPEERILSLGDQAFKIIRTTGIKPQEVFSRFKELLDEYFAIPSIATFVLGAYGEKFKENGQRTAFEEYLENLLVRSYSSKFSEYMKAKFAVSGSRRSGEQFHVSSTISIPNKKGIKIIWYLKNIGGKLMITDVKIENMSMQKTQKADIVSRIKAVGVEKFMQEFKEKYGC